MQESLDFSLIPEQRNDYVVASKHLGQYKSHRHVLLELPASSLGVQTVCTDTSNATPDVLNVRHLWDVPKLKGWPSDGAICLEGWHVEHTIEPPDEIAVPALPEHSLVLTCNRGDRQISRFAGQEYDGAGYKNHFFLVPAGIPAEFAWDSEDEAIIFSITPETLRKTAEETECINSDNVELKPLVLAQDEQITHIAHCLLHEIRMGDTYSNLFSESLLTCLSIHLLRHYCTSEVRFKPSNHGLAPYRLQQVIDYIHDNLVDGDTSLRAMAQLAELSSYYFARQFKRSTGLAPHQYVNQQRIEKAKQLLRQRKYSITQVAIECGFSDQSHFSRAFRKATDVTPKRYQQQG